MFERTRGRGGAGGRPPDGEAATAQAWMETATQTKPTTPRPLALPRPSFPRVGFLSPVSVWARPPRGAGHARPSLNLGPPRAKLEDWAALSSGGGARWQQPAPAAQPG